MNRRHAVRFVIGAAMAARALPLRAQATAAGLRRVGVLAPSTREKEEVTLKPFFDQMRALGWIEWQTIAYDRVYADDLQRDLPRLAAELVARKPELIFMPPQVAALAARQATRTIPIVFASGNDPVGVGLVASLGRPGGNATGVISYGESLVPKRLELLHEILPRARRVGYLLDPTEPLSKDDRSRIDQANALGLTIIAADMSSSADLGAAIAKLTGQGVDVIVAVNSISSNLRAQVVELANLKRVPVILSRPPMLAVGGLFAYSSSLADRIHRSAHLVDKILKGANPADIPVEQQTRFELAINLKAAKALGITVPRAALLRADEVIE
jgi:putative ABC transport system substrate-binding protein